MHQIVDNFLPDIEASIIEEYWTGPNAAWNFRSDLTFYNPDNSEQDNDHCFYGVMLWKMPHGKNNNQFDTVLPIIKKLGCKALIKIQANSYPRTNTLVKHGLHIDFPFHNRSCVYYVNTNNGYTILKDGTKIESIRNRALFFDGSEEHCSTNCTDKKIRVTLNFNHF